MSENYLAVIEKAALNPDVDVSKMQALLDMQERILQRNAKHAFINALSRVQKEMPRVKKNGKISFTDKRDNERNTPFAKLEDIDTAIRKIYQAEGFSVDFNVEYVGEGMPTLTMELQHNEGHSKKYSIRLPLDSSGSKNNLQAMGSTVSYARRYLTCMAFNIITEGEDNDGEAAKLVTIEQAAEIDNLINSLPESEKAKAAFLKYMGVETVIEISAKDYKKAIIAIENKKKVIKK